MRKITFYLLLCSIGIYMCSCSGQENTLPCGELDFHALLQPVPASAKFINDTLYIWGGTLVKSHNDNKYHLFYSRWPRDLRMSAWVTRSEIAHAVSDSPFGPYEFKDVALPARGAGYWDGLVTHNPNVHYFNGKYYLYYTGNTGDGRITGDKLNWTNRNNQRIGVAVADDPNGPWKRFDHPVVDISPDSTAHDALMTSNPSVTKMPDGRYLIIYKAVGKKREMPFGGPVVHLAAIAENPEGPFIKQHKPIFTAENIDFPAEDPYVWCQDDCIYAIVKDNIGSFTDAGRSLALFYSTDGLDWKLASHPLVTDLTVTWENGTTQKVRALERPQLFFEDGKPVALLCACSPNETADHTFNVQIPLGDK